jgi:murein L,D-transpeptidase YafK
MRQLLPLLLVVLGLLAVPGAQASKKSNAKAVAAAPDKAKAKAKAKPKPKPRPKPKQPEAGEAEARLIEVYQLLARGQSRAALNISQQLVQTYPDFHLAQLVHGDILASRNRPVRGMGDVPSPLNPQGEASLTELRAESQARLKSLTERPPEGALPAEFINLSARNKHAIAVDTSRSRLYLFANNAAGMRLVADYYISVGKSGVEKKVEGDQRTPLGVYFITSNLDPKSLTNFYGAGALPINYPNILDSQRGKTGKGIWLHGTPPGQFSRPPQATDGCVVLTNPDLRHVIQTVEIGTTPVVISHRLRWVAPGKAQTEAQAFRNALTAWQQAKSAGNLTDLLHHYSPTFNSYGKTLNDWTPVLRTEQAHIKGRSIELKDLSMLRWIDATDTMIVTFGEVPSGSRTGPTKRQYWARQGSQWKIFFEGNIG